MQQATRIRMQNLARSPFLTRRIRTKCDQLERFHPHLLGCHVDVVRQSARPGAAGPYIVTVRVATPGREIVANHTRKDNVGIALREAFAQARRMLQEDASRRRMRVETQAA